MCKKHNITAIIFDKRGKILSIGKNSYVKTHPLQAKYAKEVGEDYKIYIHAEIDAIIKCRDLSKAHTIRVLRFNKDGTEADAKPCKICARGIKEAGIERIEFTKSRENTRAHC